jgi:hypothetical protein
MYAKTINPQMRRKIPVIGVHEHWIAVKGWFACFAFPTLLIQLSVDDVEIFSLAINRSLCRTL